MAETPFTMKLSDREYHALDELCEQMDLSREQVMRQGLRLYQLCNRRIMAGEKMSWSGDEQRMQEFVGPGLQLWPPED